MNYDDLKFSVEAMSGGKNTVILDDLGKPSVMVSVPKMKYSDIIDDGSDETLPCFIVDGQELDQIWVSKYLNIVVDDRAYSLPNQDPRANIAFDTAVQVCRNKGEGWALMPNGLWGAVQGWCLKNGFMPHGNNNYGADYTYAHENGVRSFSTTDGRTGRTATGSGPATWNHDGTSVGIADLSGNVDELVSGFRSVFGEIQIIPDGCSMKSNCDLSAESTEWRAIMPDGTLVDPGTAGSLKYVNNANNIVQLGTEDGVATNGSLSFFGDMTATTGTEVPDVLKVLGLYPIQGKEYGRGYVKTERSSAEALPRRGSSWPRGGTGGLPCLAVDTLRSLSVSALGFRSVYYQLPSA